MAVDLNDYVEHLTAAVNSPGENFFPRAVPRDWVLRLQNAFWKLVLRKLISGYAVDDDDDTIVPTSGTTDIARETVQLVILVAAIDVLIQELQNAKAQFKAEAGPLSFEQQRSAITMRELLITRRTELAEILTVIAAGGHPAAYVFDNVIAREVAMATGGLGQWVGA